MTGSLPLHKVRCAFCRYWQPTLPRDSADWGYCEIWEVLESPVLGVAPCALCSQWRSRLAWRAVGSARSAVIVGGVPQVARSAPGPTLILTDPSQLDRKMVTNESFGCNHIRRIDE